jgi:hypothetical protein
VRRCLCSLYRWPNGDCSIVLARNEADAIAHLDERGNADGCPITPLRQLQVHFTLTDRCCLAFEGFSEATESAIVAFCYPDLESARDGGPAKIAEAACDERERVKAAAATPATELARSIQAGMDTARAQADGVVTTAARRRLRSPAPFRSNAGNPLPHLLDTEARAKILGPARIFAKEEHATTGLTRHSVR